MSDATLVLPTALSGQKKKKNRERMDSLLRMLSVLGFFAFWYCFTHLNNAVWHLYNPILIATPDQVVEVGFKMLQTGELQVDIVDSISRVVRGFAVAAIVGVGLGIAVSRNRIVANLVEPIIEMLRPIPSLAFLPMLVLWFGIGDLSKIVFIAYATFFPVFTSTVLGLRQIDPILVRAAQSLGARRSHILFLVELPAASPSIISGLRIGFGMAFFVIVAAEFIAAETGLGFLINNSRTFFDVPRMLLGAAVIGLIGFIVNVGLRKVEAMLLHWLPNASK
ncbi:ABC transporter permease [Rhizobium binxianense]